MSREALAKFREFRQLSFRQPTVTAFHQLNLNCSLLKVNIQHFTLYSVTGLTGTVADMERFLSTCTDDIVAQSVKVDCDSSQV